MRHSSAALTVAVCVLLGVQSVAYAGKGGGGGAKPSGGAAKFSGGASMARSMSASKPAMSNMKLNTNAGKFTQSGGSSVKTLNKNAGSLTGSIKTMPAPKRPERPNPYAQTLNASNVQKFAGAINKTQGTTLNKENVQKFAGALNGKGKNDKPMLNKENVKKFADAINKKDNSILNKENVKKLGDIFGKNGGPKDPPICDPNSNPHCDTGKYCGNGFNWCWGFPIVWNYPFPYNYANCGTVCYSDTYIQTVPAAPVVVTQTVAAEAAEPVARPIDLELVEVRQIDMGDAEHGPAYRVTIRNRGAEHVSQAFAVTVIASISRELSAEVPNAAVKVEGLQAGQAAVIDIRLPASSLAMGRNAEGARIPFTWLTTVIDGRREIEETDRDNNVLMQARSEVPMVE